jgi:hypothetical protein
MARDDPRVFGSIRRSRRIRSGCPSRLRSEDRCWAPPGSEDPFSLRRRQKTSSEKGRVSVPAALRGARKVRTRLAPRRSPKAPPAFQPALSSPGPKPRRLEHLRSLCQRRRPRPDLAFALEGRNPLALRRDPSAAGNLRASPSCASAEAPSRSGVTLPKPSPLVNRTSGRDGPESFLAFRGLLPAAIRYSRAGGLGRRAARSSPGLSALQGVPPHCGGLGFRLTIPSWAFLHRAQATGEATLQGVARSEVGSSLSRPPTLLGFVAS